MKQQDVLFILSNGNVAAISKWDGSMLWEIKLKKYIRRGMTTSIGQLSVEGDKVYVGISGILLCLSTTDGSLIWKNDLKGWGYQFINMANINNDANAAAQAQAEAATIVVMTAPTT